MEDPASDNRKHPAGQAQGAGTGTEGGGMEQAGRDSGPQEEQSSQGAHRSRTGWLGRGVCVSHALPRRL